MSVEIATEIAGKVIALVKKKYVFPDIAAEICTLLARKSANGQYSEDTKLLAKELTADLRSINHDKHLTVFGQYRCRDRLDLLLGALPANQPF